VAGLLLVAFERLTLSCADAPLIEQEVVSDWIAEVGR
jgi:hypothetical protein